MVKGKINPNYLDNEFILSKISEYDIYRYYLGDFKPNKPIASPFRAESSPSFVVNSHNGRLYHIDYGTGNRYGDAFQFVKQLFGLKYDQALHKIASDFGLSAGDHTYKRIISQYKKPEIKDKGETLIQVKTKKFDTADLAYWNRFYQDITDLKREDIYSIKKLYINKVRIPLSPTELIFGYLYEDKYWKIYRPYAKDRKDKWRTNCPIDLIEGLDNLKNCQKGIITKSKKDKMCMLKVFAHVGAVHSENRKAFNEKSIKFINENVKIPYLSFDSDEPGKTASILITKELGWKHLNVPDKYLSENIKDTAALTEAYGLPSLKKMLNIKKIY